MADQALAEANFRKALGGLNRLLWEIENPRWSNIPGFMAARRELTHHAIGIFHEFIDTQGNEPAVRYQMGRAYEMLVNVLLVYPGNSPMPTRLTCKPSNFSRNCKLRIRKNRTIAWCWRAGAKTMGDWDFSRKLPGPAKVEYQGAMEALRNALPYDRDGCIHNNLAFLLCDCQEVELRDPHQAVALATQALAQSPQQSAYWTTLGLAHYRAGEWQAALTAIDKSMALGADDACFRTGCSAHMIEWRRDDRQQAQAWYAKAATWLEHNPMTDELYHFRREASDMMGIQWPKDSPK